jgi:hypothetical protein
VISQSTLLQIESNQIFLNSNMGRGLAWDAIERQIAAKAIVSASQNSINGADQHGADFAATVHRYVVEFQPSDAEAKKYGGRTAK